MVDAVRMSLGVSPETKAQRVQNTELKQVRPVGGAVSPTPVVQPTVGFKPQTPTGVVPKSTQELAADNYIAPVKATKLESAGAAMGGVAIDLYRGVRSALIYDTDPDFNHKALSDEFFTKFGAGTPLEVKYLASAKSYQDWQDRQGYIQDQRMRDAAMADNPWTSAAASIVDADLALSVVPIVGLGSKAARAAGASTAVRNTTRVGAGVVAGGALATTQSMLGDSTLRTEGQQLADIAVFGLARALAPLSKPLVAEGAVVRAADATPTPLDDAGVSVPEVPITPIQDATEAVVPLPPKEEALAAANTVGMTREQIMKLPQKKQRAAWIKQNTQRRNAVADVETRYAASKAAEEQAAAVKVAREVEDELVVIQERARTESPAQKFIKNKYVARFTSTADELNHLTQGDTTTPINKLLSNPATNNGEDMISLKNVYLNNYAHRLIGVEDSLKDAVAVHTKGQLFARVTGKYDEAYRVVGSDVQEAIQKLDADVLAYHKAAGAVPNRQALDNMLKQQGNHPAIDKAVREYIDSGLAVQVHRDTRTKGWVMREVTQPDGTVIKVNAFDDIVERPTYLPLKHSFDAMENAVNTGKASWDNIADFVGAQIVRTYPELLMPTRGAENLVLTERQVGQHFIQTQRDKSRSLADIAVTGISKEDITTLLTKTGRMTDKDARVLADSMFEGVKVSGDAAPKNLRRRMDWDWSTRLTTDSGYSLGMRDIVDSSILGTLEDYTRTMAHRNALAEYGIMSPAELDTLFESFLSKLPKGTDVQHAKQFFKNTRNVLLGNPIDAYIPEGIRASQVMAALWLLANSGLYTFVELATQMQKVGVIRSLPAMKQGLRVSTRNLSELSITDAKSVEDIVSGRLLATTKFKNFTVRYADNFEVRGNLAGVAQYYGQTARFMNGSETVKRFQVGVLAGVYMTNLRGAMKGTASEIKFMKKHLKMSDDLIADIKVEYAKHGDNLDDWSNGVRVKYEQKLFSDADNLAMNVHEGEIPAILEHSAVGRVIFPFMTYAFAMQNKVLRRTHERDGAAGIARIMAVQIPAAMLVGAAINVRSGKEWDDNLTQMTIRSMTAMGSLNYPIETMMAGLNGGGVTALAPYARTYALGKEVLTGGADDEISLRQVKTNSPINALVPLDIFILATEDD